MKTINLFLIFAIMGYCFTDGQDECITEFEVQLQSKCQAIDSSCNLTSFSQRCISKNNNDCSKGNGDQTICQRIFPNDFPKNKCVYNSGNNICEKKRSVCSDYNNGIYGIYFQEDKGNCALLTAENGKDSCRIADDGTCKSYYDSCSSELSSSQCTDNLLSNYKKNVIMIHLAQKVKDFVIMILKMSMKINAMN